MLAKGVRFLAAFTATPFLITLLARPLPLGSPLWLPSLAVLAAAGTLWVGRRWLRSVALGLACGTFAHAVLLLWIFARMGDGLDKMG